MMQEQKRLGQIRIEAPGPHADRRVVQISVGGRSNPNWLIPGLCGWTGSIDVDADLADEGLGKRGVAEFERKGRIFV